MRAIVRSAALALVVVLFLAVLAACAEQFTFEAHPSGTGDADSWEGDPDSIECFTIEADSSNGDDDDQQLGEFCKVDDQSEEAQDDIENEQDDDD